MSKSYTVSGVGVRVEVQLAPVYASDMLMHDNQTAKTVYSSWTAQVQYVA